ncbi:MAG: M42 family metallopeptidase [Candidatus Omnitrophica bacterium]|nr:M42 family metallopeptidase [Candidatus Omnitrophota bacterium]
MDKLLQTLLDTAGISGYEKEVAQIMKKELKKCSENVFEDNFGNVIAQKGKGKKKIMLAAHMDEIGLLVKHISKEGFLYFIKVGGIDDRILLGQRVIIKSAKGDVKGVIGAKPPHLSKEEDRKNAIKYTDLFIDIGAKDKDEAQKRVSVGDAIVFDCPSFVLNGQLICGKAVDNRVGCYALIKIMEKLSCSATVYAVATVQEEVGLKGARTSSFRIAPDFALALDTTSAGDTPGIKETESSLKLGGGVAITIMEAAGRGVIVSENVRNLCIETAKKHKIKYQIDVLEGGMTDAAMIYMNREGIPTAVLSIPCRYVHAPTAVFDLQDLRSAIDLSIKIIERVIG